MRELELMRADPAGNVTLLVLTPVEAPLRSAAARALLRRCGADLYDPQEKEG